MTMLLRYGQRSTLRAHEHKTIKLKFSSYCIFWLFYFLVLIFLFSFTIKFESNLNKVEQLIFYLTDKVL